MPHTTVLAICGSLRVRSLNRSLLQAVEAAAPEFRFVGAELVPDLPLFDADRDEWSVSGAVREFRLLASAARAAVIVSPEYAHGPSGVTKNALEWLVDSAGVAGKPVLLASASPGRTGGLRGIAGLLPTLDLLGADLVDPITVSRAVVRLGDDGEVLDPALDIRIRIAIGDLRTAMGISAAVA